MKFLTAFLFLITATIQAQVDKGNSIAIPATKNNTTKSTAFPSSKSDVPAIDFSQFNKPKSDKFDITGAKKPDFTTPTEEFKNPGDVTLKKLTKTMGKDSPEFAKKENIHFGTFTVNQEMVTIRYLDYGNVDGDMVKVVLNDKTIYSSITLYGEFKEVRIPMIMGLNKLEIFALNEGLYSPNTAKFQLYESQRQMISGDWSLLTGFKAIFIINRIK